MDQMNFCHTQEVINTAIPRLLCSFYFMDSTKFLQLDHFGIDLFRNIDDVMWISNCNRFIYLWEQIEAFLPHYMFRQKEPAVLDFVFWSSLNNRIIGDIWMRYCFVFKAFYPVNLLIFLLLNSHLNFGGSRAYLRLLHWSYVWLGCHGLFLLVNLMTRRN